MIAPVSCALGTHLEAGRCVVDAVACAPGTHLEVDRCVADPPPALQTSWGANVRVCAEGAQCFEPQVALAADEDFADSLERLREYLDMMLEPV